LADAPRSVAGDSLAGVVALGRSGAAPRLAAPRTWRRNVMEWRTPKLVEIACGCEINAYFPADL
jgi:coenzyme PQQ precursor peptide PqqA